MATKRIAVLLLALIVFTGLANCARQKSPLLVEDDGSRRNRPAGEFFLSFKVAENQRSCVAYEKSSHGEMTCQKAFS
jgi:hypothetical protein